MSRIPSAARPALLLSGVLLLASCASGGRPPSAPEPEPVPAAAEELGAGPELAPAAAPAPAAAGILGTARYDLPVVANGWVERELDFLVNQRHAVIGRWLERGDRYQAFVERVFAGYGLPTDLHHLAMVESGYSPTARSHAGAVGMWQFMTATGKGMGLRVDSLVDERMDPVRSTHAAARHLRDLHRRFGGDWPLAAAAYNAGTGRISRGLGQFGVRTFWELATVGNLAAETKHYVPRLYAVTIIGRDRTRFGYPAARPVARPFAYDSAWVDVATPLSDLSRIGGILPSTLVELNPHLHRSVVPAGYWVWVPAGRGGEVQTAFNASDFRREGGRGSYAVRTGDDLGRIAELAGLSVERIRELNPSVRPDALSRGQRIVLPGNAARALNARPPERLAARETEEERPSRTRSARRGRDPEEKGVRGSSTSREERSSSSERTASAERSSSRRSESASASSDRSSSPERSSSSSRGSESASSSPREGRSSPSSASRPERPRLRAHTVEGGETLWSLARRYEVTVDAIKEANELQGTTLRPGQELRIPRPVQLASRDTESRSTRGAESERETVSRSSSEGRRSSSSTASREGGTPTAEGRRSPASSTREAAGATASEGRRSTSSAAASSSSTASARREGERSTGTARRPSRPQPSFARHVVRTGDTLWSLARRYEVSVDAIKDANELSAAVAIQPGQELRIPQ